MSVQRTLQKYMDDWKRISHFDFCLLQEDNSILVTTCDTPPSSRIQTGRIPQQHCSLSVQCHLLSLQNHRKERTSYLLIVWGSEDSVSTIGELAVCQIESILESYAEKNDKNAFMQKLLLGNYTDVEAFNRATQASYFFQLQGELSFSLKPVSPRMNTPWLPSKIYFLHARMILSLLSMISGIIVVRELTSAETYDDLENIAHMLVDMLGTEAMTQAWVAYSNTADDLKDLSNAYKEARTALEIR